MMINYVYNLSSSIILEVTMKLLKRLFGRIEEDSIELQLNCVYRHKFDENKPLRLITKALNDDSYQYIRVSRNTGRKNVNPKVGNINFLLDNYDCIEKIN